MAQPVKHFYLNFSTILGIVIGFLLIILSVFLSAEKPSIFVNLPGLLIVLGGVIAATFISYPWPELKKVWRSFKYIWAYQKYSVDEEIEEIAMVSMWLAKGRLGDIEDEMNDINNQFLRTGIQLIIDGASPDEINDLLGWRIFKLQQQEQAEADVFLAMANFAPAFGMAGTLLGLVNMLFSMSDSNFEAIGFNLALALTTTLYGIVLANLFLRPIAIKLERRTERRVMLMYMVMEGISLLGQRRTASYIRETLASFIAQYEDEISASSLNEIERKVAQKLSAQGVGINDDS